MATRKYIIWFLCKELYFGKLLVLSMTSLENLNSSDFFIQVGVGFT